MFLLFESVFDFILKLYYIYPFGLSDMHVIYIYTHDSKD